MNADGTPPGPDQSVPVNPRCDLCEAAKTTPWFYEDAACWIAECEFCAVPMVVWRPHAASPPEDVRNELHRRLVEVARAHYGVEVDFFIDDKMRNIPDHYHAHARRRSPSFGRR